MSNDIFAIFFFGQRQGERLRFGQGCKCLTCLLLPVLHLAYVDTRVCIAGIFAVLCFIYHLAGDFHILSIFPMIYGRRGERLTPKPEFAATVCPCSMTGLQDTTKLATTRRHPPASPPHPWCNLDKWPFFILMLIIS